MHDYELPDNLSCIFAQISSKKTDEKYLAKCGTERGQLLFRDPFYPETQLCAANFDGLFDKGLTGSLVGRSDWTGPSDWHPRDDSWAEISRSGKTAHVFNETFKAYQVCTPVC